jgi:hypothetical protein
MQILTVERVDGRSTIKPSDFFLIEAASLGSSYVGWAAALYRPGILCSFRNRALFRLPSLA